MNEKLQFCGICNGKSVYLVCVECLIDFCKICVGIYLVDYLDNYKIVKYEDKKNIFVLLKCYRYY